MWSARQALKRRLTVQISRPDAVPEIAVMHAASMALGHCTTGSVVLHRCCAPHG